MNARVIQHIIIAALFSIVAPVTYAQIASDGSLPSKNKFDSVFVVDKTPSDIELRRRSLVAKQVYGREEIDRHGDSNMADALANLPGIRVLNGAASLSGMDPKYTKVQIDGDPLPSGMSLEQISPALVERVEVTKGHTAGQKGQAIAGTINIVLKEPGRTSQSTLRYGAQYQNEHPTPFLFYSPTEKIGRLSYSLPINIQTLFQTYQLNTVVRFADPAGAVSSGYQERNWRYGLEFATFSPKIVYSIDDDNKVTSQMYLQLARRLLKHNYNRVVYSGDPLLDDNMESEGIWRVFKTDVGLVSNLDENRRIELKGGVRASHGTQGSNTMWDSNIRSTKYEDEAEDGVKFRGVYQAIMNDAHTVSVGVDYDKVSKYQIKNNDYLGKPVSPLVWGKTFTNSLAAKALFVEDEWEFSKSLGFNIGMRAEAFETTVRAPDEISTYYGVQRSWSNTINFFHPVAHFRFKPSGGSTLIRGSYGRGYRAPELHNLDMIPVLGYRNVSVLNSKVIPDSIGNTNLKPENATSLDFSVERQFGKGASCTVNAFFRDVNDIIVDLTSLRSVYWSPVDRWVTQPINVEHGVSYGLESEIRGPASDLLPVVFNAPSSLSLRISLNLYGSRIDAVEGPNNRFAKQSPWTLTLGADYKTSRSWTLGMSAYFVPGYDRRGLTANETFRQSPLQWVNAYATNKLDAKSSLRLGVNNVFPATNSADVNYLDSFTRANRMGRTALTITFDSQF